MLANRKLLMALEFNVFGKPSHKALGREGTSLINHPIVCYSLNFSSIWENYREIFKEVVENEGNKTCLSVRGKRQEKVSCGAEKMNLSSRDFMIYILERLMQKGCICTPEIQCIGCSPTAQGKDLMLGLGRKIAMNIIP